LFNRFLGKQLGFYDLFEKHASTALVASRVMLEAAKDLSNCKEKVYRIEELEHECDSIAHMTIDLLHRTFITPLDRDEILGLVSKMDDVIDHIEAAAHRLLLFEIKEVPAKMIQLCEVLIKTEEEVEGVVKLLRKIKVEDVLKHCLEINSLENEGDRLNRDGIAELFHTYTNDPLMVIKLKEIYEILEMAIDRCEDVANIAESIVLEHS
jgi:uncharacterized protein